MTARYTPGPWVVDDNSHDIRTHNDHWPPGCTEGNLIAYVAHTEDVMGAANAQAIAAVPDLVEACRAAYWALRLGGFSRTVHAQEDVEAALRKAGVEP